MTAQEQNSVVLSEKFGAVGIVTIQRPQRRNALNFQVKQELESALRALEKDDEISVLVLTGGGGCFVAGTDIAEMSKMQSSDHTRQQTDRIFRTMRELNKPVIAAVEGYALGGGCELALSCDIVIVADDALLGQPEIKVGIMPGAGGTQRLLRSAGRQKTLLWTLTGQMISAREAYAANLISKLVPRGQALEHAREVAEIIATMPPLAVSAIREAVRLGADVPMEAALSLERRLFERLFDSFDQKEGMNAFLEKRKPIYRGN